MSEDTRILGLEIEQLARERDDFLDITALRGQNGWEALVRKIDAEEKLKMDALLALRDPPLIFNDQGYIGALRMVKQIVEMAEEGAKNRNEQIADKTHLKDQLLEQIAEQQEYEKRESLSPQF